MRSLVLLWYIDEFIVNCVLAQSSPIILCSQHLMSSIKSCLHCFIVVCERFVAVVIMYMYC